MHPSWQAKGVELKNVRTEAHNEYRLKALSRLRQSLPGYGDFWGRFVTGDGVSGTGAIMLIALGS